MKTLLILVDGMRPDCLVDIPYAQTLMKKSSYSLDVRTVFPSVTLPCHMSLFHSVTPERHGITTNTYSPLARPLNGLCEQLALNEKSCAFFYNWAQLSDLARPGSLSYSYFVSGNSFGYENSNRMLTENAVSRIRENAPDFAFLYLGWVDEAGHKFGWGSDEYMRSLAESWKSIEELIGSLSDEYSVIVTADHGGHDRNHGTELPEDMTIPVFFYGKPFEAGKELHGLSILDFAPTIAKMLDTKAASEWEGKTLI